MDDDDVVIIPIDVVPLDRLEKVDSWTHTVRNLPGAALDTPDLDMPPAYHRDDATAAAARRLLFT